MPHSPAKPNFRLKLKIASVLLLLTHLVKTCSKVLRAGCTGHTPLLYVHLADPARARQNWARIYTSALKRENLGLWHLLPKI